MTWHRALQPLCQNVKHYYLFSLMPRVDNCIVTMILKMQFKHIYNQPQTVIIQLVFDSFPLVTPYPSVKLQKGNVPCQ
jgi:hypothetical protein